MCQATIILHDGNETKEILKDVIHLKVEEKSIVCSRFFEEPTPIKAAIQEIDFLKHLVHLVPIHEDER
ncbi:MAG: CooT family nickel-binding protein [Anaerolineales bacterium]|jgi:predicted RNA-binding protein